MTRANTNSKSRTPKVQRKYLPKDVLNVMNVLPRNPILDLMESSGPGRKFASPEPILRAYYLSRLQESGVPEKATRCVDSAERKLDGARRPVRLCGSPLLGNFSREIQTSGR